MVKYRPPAAYRRPKRSYSPALGQTFDEILGWPPAMGDILRLVYHTGGTWLGIYVGTREKGALSVVGWAIGLGMGLAAVLDLVSLGKRVAGTHPPEKTETPPPPTAVV